MSDGIKGKPNAVQTVIQLILFAIAIASTTVAAMQGMFIRQQNEQIMLMQTDIKALYKITAAMDIELAVNKVDLYGKVNELIRSVDGLKVDVKALRK